MNFVINIIWDRASRNVLTLTWSTLVESDDTSSNRLISPCTSMTIWTYWKIRKLWQKRDCEIDEPCEEVCLSLLSTNKLVCLMFILELSNSCQIRIDMQSIDESRRRRRVVRVVKVRAVKVGIVKVRVVKVCVYRYLTNESKLTISLALFHRKKEPRHDFLNQYLSKSVKHIDLGSQSVCSRQKTF